MAININIEQARRQEMMQIILPPLEIPIRFSILILTVRTIRSRKGLLSMATFAAPTRLIVSGLELEHGLILSKEASIYATRIIEVSIESLLDRTDEHVEYLRYFDKSPILLIDRLGPKKEMMTLDLAPEVEDFGGGKCFHLLRLAQLAALGYKVSVLPGAFAASYPKTREALCTDSFQKSSPLQQCDCELDSEATIKEILIDEVKKSAKVAVLMKEIDSQAITSQ